MLLFSTCRPSDLAVAGLGLVLALAPVVAQAQASRAVSGTVTDNTVAPVPGVTVLQKGTTTSTLAGWRQVGCSANHKVRVTTRTAFS